MTETRKPFLSIAEDVDDEMLEAMARKKGVPALTATAAPQAADRRTPVGSRAGQGTSRRDSLSDRATTPDVGPTPRARMSYVKACLPDYALTALKTRAIVERVSINHVLMKALAGIGIAIRPEDMIEDGRRLRGNKHLNQSNLSS